VVGNGWCLKLYVHAYREGEGSELKPMDAEQLREQAHKMVDFIADYYNTIENFPVRSQVEVIFLYTLSIYFYEYL
jgi:tyrosine decarboxylase